MKAWTDISSIPILLKLDHIDTDMIIPAQYLTSTLKTGYSEGLFKNLREQDADFPLNKISLGERTILVAGHNFGCGSSREHAVWAIQEFGIKCVIAKSFGDIFKANSLKNGLLPIELKDESINEIFNSKHPDNSLSINLEKQEVVVGNIDRISFEINQFRKHCLLEGVDDLRYILELKEQIKEFRLRQEKTRFFDTWWAVK